MPWADVERDFGGKSRETHGTFLLHEVQIRLLSSNRIHMTEHSYHPVISLRTMDTSRTSS